MTDQTKTAQHTPGPWILLHDLGNGEYRTAGIAYQWQETMNCACIADETTGRNITRLVIPISCALIAPQLLEVARLVIQSQDESWEGDDGVEQSWDTLGLAIEKARAAIAAAQPV